MREIEISGQTYRIGSIAAMRQLHIVRRVAPALVGVLGLSSIKAAADGNLNFRELIDKLEPFMEALGAMKDEDVDYVMDNCLAVVERKVPGDRGWQRVGTTQALMYDDIDLLVMLRLSWEAGRENLEGFIVAFQQMFPSLRADPNLPD
jgi:hypothetical protein